MFAIARALVAASLLPVVAWAQAPPSGERLLGAKLATVERGRPLEPGELSPPQADALGCATPCASGNISAAHPYYDVYLSCGNGAFTARTGASHSVTAAAGGIPQNVIFGGGGGAPGTSDIAFFVHDTGTQYTNPAGAAACVFDPPDTLAEPMSVGLEQEWSLTNSPGMDLTFRQELVAFGSTEENSGVRMTLSITNRPSSTVPATVGMRWQIDYQNASDDGPLFSPVICDPPSVGREYAGEHDFLDSEIEDFYRIRNNSGFPIFSNVTSTTPLSGIPNTSRPDRLVFGRWGALRGSAWDYTAFEGDPGVDADSAVLYFFGYQPADAFVLVPGGTVARTVVIFTSSAGVDCGEFTPGCAPSVTNPPVDRTLCVGDSTTLDASGLGLTDCAGSVEHEWRDPGGVIANVAVVDVSPAVDTEYTVTASCSTDPACLTRERILVTVDAPPELQAGLARDADPCNEGLIIEWEPAAFGDVSAGAVYNLHRSTVSCADALAAPPLVTGLTGLSWFDASTEAGTNYFYVVEAEDGRMPTACTPQGPHHGGGIDRLCLAPVVDEGPPAPPAGTGIVLFLTHDGDSVELRWDGVRPLVAAEHFHLLKLRRGLDDAFFQVNQDRHRTPSWTETDSGSRLQFFDLRIADHCESISADDFPPG
jgi:hypothetical protein